MKINKTVIAGFTAVLFLIAIFSFMLETQNTVNLPFKVKLISDDSYEEIECWKKSEDQCYVFLPAFAELSDVKIVTKDDFRINIGGRELGNGTACSDLEFDVQYDLSYKVNGKQNNKKLTFVKSANIASMYIDTQSGSTEYIRSDKENQEEGRARLYSAGGILNCSAELLSINGHGNSTWQWSEKKPYDLEFAEDVNLLEMGAAKRWVLLANSFDPSHLRNKIVYDFSKNVGMLSPDSQWVDLYLNGEYAGLYLLCEKIEIHSERVDISTKNSFLVSMEIKERLITAKKPFVDTDYQTLRLHTSYMDKNSISEILSAVENAILSKSGIDSSTGKSWQELIDLDSWAKKYLIEEIFSNYDACFISQYFYYDGNSSEKLFAGPVWDFDNSIDLKVWMQVPPNTLLANRLSVCEGMDSPWFHALYAKEEFYNRIVELYAQEFLPLLEDFMETNIESYAETIEKACIMDGIRWEKDTDISVQAAEIEKFLDERLQFLNSVWIEETQYVTLCLKNGEKNHSYICIESGECYKELPELEDTDEQKFVGWYYEDTDEPFDVTKPITADISVYAKWENTSSEQLKEALKILPIGVILLLGSVIFIIDIKRNKRS